MDDTAKARMRLYLRSERARGLNAVPAMEISQAAEPVTDSKRAVPQTVNVKTPPKPFTHPVNQPATSQLAMLGSAVSAQTAPLVSPGQPFTAPLLSTEEKRQRLLAMNEKE